MTARTATTFRPFGPIYRQENLTMIDTALAILAFLAFLGLLFSPRQHRKSRKG